MDQVQTYGDLKAKKAEADMQNKQKAQQGIVAEQGLNDYTANPELARYFASQQSNIQPQIPQIGLEPAQNTDVNASDYTRIAAQVANSVGSQEEYAQVMFDGVTKGKVDPRAFLEDAGIPKEAKQTLISLIQDGPQNEQASMGLNPR